MVVLTQQRLLQPSVADAPLGAVAALLDESNITSWGNSTETHLLYRRQYFERPTEHAADVWIAPAFVGILHVLHKHLQDQATLREILFSLRFLSGGSNELAGCLLFTGVPVLVW